MQIPKFFKVHYFIWLPILAAILFLKKGVIDSGDSGPAFQAETYLPIIVLIAIGVATGIYAFVKNSRKRSDASAGALLAGRKKNSTTKFMPTQAKRMQGLEKTIDLGIGTGVVKIFQQIKDNIGNVDSLSYGYRHLLDLACEQLGFDGGAAFLIDENGLLRLRGHSGIILDSHRQNYIEGAGVISELFHSDFPRLETDLSKISGDCQDLFKDFMAAWLLPLMPQGHPVGLIMFLHREIPDHQEDFFPKLDFVGIAASWFYENHINEILIGKENKRNKMLVQTSLDISVSLDLDHVCNILVAHLGKAYGCSYSYILLNQGAENEMFVRQYFSERGEPVFSAEERFIYIGNMSWLLDIISAGNPVLLETDEIAALLSEHAKILKIFGSNRALVAPIKHRGTVTGVLFMVEQRSGSRSTMEQDVISLTAAIVAQASAAIDNARMYQMITERVAHLSTLIEVGQALNSDLDLIPFIDRVLQAISKNFNISNCAYLMKDHSSNELMVTSIVGKYPPESLGKRLKIGVEGITGHAAMTMKVINVGDVNKDDRFVKSTGTTGSELAVPVILNGIVEGVIDVESESKFAFSHREEELLASLIDQIAAAIEKLKLKQQERERTQKLAVTNAIVKKLSEIRDQDELLNEAVKRIKEGFGHDLVAIFVPDKKGILKLARQSCQAGIGYDPGFQLLDKKSLIIQTAEKKAGVYQDNLNNSPCDNLAKNVISRCCLPLVAGNKLHGVLDIQNSRSLSFSQIDKSMTQTIAEFLAVAMNNINLYSDSLEKAERLRLTSQVSQAITSTLEIEDLFDRIIKSLSELTGYHWATLVFKDKGEFKTSSEYFKRATREDGDLPSIKSLQKYFKEVLVHGKTVYFDISKMAIEEPLLNYFAKNRVNYIAISPIEREESRSSFLLVGNPNSEGFRPQDQHLLNDVSNQLRIALNNAILYTKLKKAYNRVEETQAKLLQSEKFKALGEVAAGIAHDFKNIMAAIVGRVQLITIASDRPGGIDPEVLKKGLNIIEKSAGDGVNILSRINEFTKSKNALKFAKLDLREVIEDTVEMTRSKWQNPDDRKTIKINTHYKGDMHLMGDRAMMVEVFSNLIYNAVDAIEQEGGIDVNAEQSDDKIIIRVNDTGSGIDPQTLKKIFDPFFTTKHRLGTGLGLAMVYAIIDKHGGEIGVESRVGSGTTFTLKLPRQGKPEIAGSLSILIVEDDMNLRNVLSELFSELDIKIALAGTFHDASELLHKGKFDIILTDLGLPDKDGWGIVDLARSLAPESFIVPMTGWNKEIDKKELLSRGLMEILQKPFTIDRVYELIDIYNKRKAHVSNFA